MRIRATTQFKRDVQRCQKRGYRMERLKNVIDCLEGNQPLDPALKNHRLIGNYDGAQECHIQPDWLLIYERDGDDLYLVRTGTHSDLFE